MAADDPFEHPNRQKDAWESVTADVLSLMLKTHLDELLTKRVLNYRSDLKRVIALVLAQNPRAKDIDVCRSLDEQGVECRWGRSFETVYMDGTHKSKIETTISKVRADMRKHGLFG